ncbi:Nitrilase, partial [Lunasporangiospora selenospora]
SLLRSRAIETQTYVVASAHVGQHSPKRSSYGHSMIIDPWGRILADCGDQAEALAVAEVDLATLDRIRTEMPIMKHRRRDIYQQV